jgi:hypothetical protein
MTTIARTLVSVPQRSSKQTWDVIVDLVAPDTCSAARKELAMVAGVACSCISDEALADDAIVVHGVGPRLRVYALYGDDALDGERASESSLSWVPTDGDWRMSIPCLEDDLAWVRAKLAKTSSRVTARVIGAVEADDHDEAASQDAARVQKTRTTYVSDNFDAVDLEHFFRR